MVIIMLNIVLSRQLQVTKCILLFIKYDSLIALETKYAVISIGTYP